jgi:hypothetical protein
MNMKKFNKKELSMSLNKKLLAKHSLKPLDTSVRQHKHEKIMSSPINSHMEQLSSILGEDFNRLKNREVFEANSAELVRKQDTKFDQSYGSIVPNSALNKKSFLPGGIIEENEELEVDPSHPVSPSNSAKRTKIENLEEDSPQFDQKNSNIYQEQIDDINFISILMYVDGEENGLSIANDRQFQEI